MDQISGLKKISEEKIDPVTLAQELTTDADSAIALVQELKKLNTKFNAEYGQELDDVQTWALLSQYFATKLRAGVALQFFRKNGLPVLFSFSLLYKNLHSSAINITDLQIHNFTHPQPGAVSGK